MLNSLFSLNFITFKFILILFTLRCNLFWIFLKKYIIGTGTFGRVRLVKFKNDPSSEVYALKILKKTEIVRLNQVDHIKSEKQIL